MLGLFGCSTPPTADELRAISAPVDVDQNVRAAVIAQARHAKPRTSIASLSGRSSIDHKGNFGCIIYYNEDIKQFFREDGILVRQSTMSAESDQAESVTESLSLCGLVQISSVSLGRSRLNVSTAAPIPGGGVLPISSTTDINRRLRAQLLSLAITEGDICAPIAGGRLSFSSTTATSFIQFGAMTFRNKSTETLEVNCDIGQPTAAPGDSLAGPSLPVACKLKSADGSERAESYDFLVNSNQYLVNGSKTKWQTSTTKYHNFTAK